jgi:hypothetical protein
MALAGDDVFNPLKLKWKGGMRLLSRSLRTENSRASLRVIEAPAGFAPKDYPFLMESLFLRSRWYVNARGEPAYADSPKLILKPAPVQSPRGEDRTSLCWRRR